MIELRGKYNTAKVYTDNIESEAISQILELCNQDFVKDSNICIMPDTHAGAGCTIGTTMTIKDKVVPNLVGVDIGCGMLTIKLADTSIDFAKLDATIRQYIPSGSSIRQDITLMSNIEYMRCLNKANINVSRAFMSLGTLGGGNHFIEVDKGVDGCLYLVIHTGSRHLGLEVCKYYQEEAYAALTAKFNKGNKKEKRQQLIDSLKAVGRTKEISDQVKLFDKNYSEQNPDIPKALAYCEGTLFDDYLYDMELTQEHASMNRELIAHTILKKMQLHEVSRFETVHNYIDTTNMILRKGAISAQEGELVLIPMNMRDGSLICVGKGNPDWNYSAPHGAGRLMSRSKAKESVTLDEFEESMEGIWTSSVCSATIDESPMAYKPMDEILKNVRDSVVIVDTIKPVYNFKAN